MIGAVCCAVLSGALYSADSKPAKEKEPSINFEQHVRPILKANCFHCHGEEGEPKGALDLRLRRFLVAGGDLGEAIVPGKPDESLLLTRLRDGEMPPPKVEKRLTADEIKTIERWIAAGAPTLRKEPESIGRGMVITDEDRQFWSFRPVVRSAPPNVKNRDRVRTPIDQFLLSRLEQEDESFAADADKRTLLRRAYFDLLGLPPTPEESNAFLNDSAPDAYERLVDRLLASPRYGERWGRHWLDVAGYADSEGFSQADTQRKWAYKYRDYVIDAWNANKPIDRFLVQQLAGDELVGSLKNLKGEDIENLVATGFLRMAPDGTGDSGVDQNTARNAVVADTIHIVSTSLLGLTVNCAQCHHHRYDPIPQSDYYRLRAVFEPAYDWKNWRKPAQRLVSLYTDDDRAKSAEIEKQAKAIEAERTKKQTEYIQRTLKRELAKLPDEIRETVRAARETPAKKRTDAQKKLLRDHPSVNVSAGSLYLYDKKAADDLKEYQERAKKARAAKPAEELVRCLTEVPDRQPPPTFVFFRGSFEQPKEQVEPGELTVLTSKKTNIPLDDSELASSGRRLAYARWLTSGKHPLVARVFVNRIWMHHFGRGIVETPGDFGVLGARPTHPKLLDWLASEFVAGGWNLKDLHRLIMTSTAYRQSSRRRDSLQRIDIDNRLLGRMNMRRLEAEVVRDSLLSVSGRLLSKRFGPPVPVMADRVGQFVVGIENLNAGRPGAVIPMKGEDLRRSVYIEARRSRPLAVLDTFDSPAMSPNCKRRPSSTVTPQSLLLMNGKFVIEQSRALARRVAKKADDDDARVRRVWRLALAGQPDEQQLRESLQFIKEQAAFYLANPADAAKKGDKKYDEAAARQDALAVLCQALLGSNEFLYID